MGLTSNFLYFAYGSNLLAKRIHIKNPTAQRYAIGKLSGYRLDFNRYSKYWDGASATIVPDEGHTVWGAIWEIDEKNRADLDDQEGVSSKIYFPLEVGIETPAGNVIKCRVYQMVDNPVKDLSGNLPDIRKPSFIYRETIIQGAIESGLPTSYVDHLKTIPHNNKMGDRKLSVQLGLNIH